MSTTRMNIFEETMTEISHIFNDDEFVLELSEDVQGNNLNIINTVLTRIFDIKEPLPEIFYADKHWFLYEDLNSDIEKLFTATYYRLLIYNLTTVIWDYLQKTDCVAFKIDINKIPPYLNIKTFTKSLSYMLRKRGFNSLVQPNTVGGKDICSYTDEEFQNILNSGMGLDNILIYVDNTDYQSAGLCASMQSSVTYLFNLTFDKLDLQGLSLVYIDLSELDNSITKERFLRRYYMSLSNFPEAITFLQNLEKCRISLLQDFNHLSDEDYGKSLYLICENLFDSILKFILAEEERLYCDKRNPLFFQRNKLRFLCSTCIGAGLEFRRYYQITDLFEEARVLSKNFILIKPQVKKRYNDLVNKLHLEVEEMYRDFVHDYTYEDYVTITSKFRNIKMFCKLR